MSHLPRLIHASGAAVTFGLPELEVLVGGSRSRNEEAGISGIP
jgi:hypothetical protein